MIRFIAGCIVGALGGLYFLGWLTSAQREVQMGCGCRLGAHRNDATGWMAAHPQVITIGDPDPDTSWFYDTSGGSYAFQWPTADTPAT